MTVSLEPSSSAAGADPSTAAIVNRILRAISARAPQLWFPIQYAEETGLPRASLDEPLWKLRQAGLVHVGDWVAGLGQGFWLTREGQKAVDHPDPLSLAESAEFIPVVAASPAPRPAIVAPALILANGLWFGLGLLFAWKEECGIEYLKGDLNAGTDRILLRLGAVDGLHLLLGQWWRLLTCCFVHIGAFHLLGNMLMLGILGPVAEEHWGRRRFALLYFVSGLVGSAAAMALHPQADSGRDVLLAGASGAILGILLSVCVWLLRYRDRLPAEIAAEWGRKLFLTVFLSFLLILAPGVSLDGHLGGGLAGAALAYWLDRRWRPHWSLSLLGTTVLIAAALAGLACSLVLSDDWKAVRQRHGFPPPFADVSKPANER